MRYRLSLARSLISVGALTVVFASAASAGESRPAMDVGKTPQDMIVDRMGLTMPESHARHEVAFRPFAPPRRIIAVALLPPFHGDDTRANRGIGFEFLDETGRRYALAQWPANGGSIERFASLVRDEPGCANARTFRRGTKPNGIVWSTPHGLIMTLQADGANDAQTLEIEWRKLIRRGVCR